MLFDFHFGCICMSVYAQGGSSACLHWMHILCTAFHTVSLQELRHASSQCLALVSKSVSSTVSTLAQNEQTSKKDAHSQEQSCLQCEGTKPDRELPSTLHT